ncbi:carbon-monoxide dehydrogenase large subunit [Gemmobacter aquatilis]|uniref:Carbon-monoxide dehydrogenase large subunit n=1 Tax=Gemmobacter aquatilis TaxID=933059 RepID=A0A1H8CEV8_9RHOB|nr:xanthine dehydrogenase family protein molybdopterin-binding subunit [Gemmobacter aquatilis]SEM93530.1 carbon-monoxide dehydrogenase large subunit [Gemmobacter aquatilis]
MFGRAQGRIEDARFLTGQGRYVDDIVPEGALFAAFLRSPMAHAEITALDVSAARVAPGVALVLTAEDLRTQGVVLGMAAHRTRQPDGTRGVAPERPVLAQGRVRFVGEPLVMVVAETAEQARDALDLIEVDYAELPAAVAFEGEAAIFPEAPGNRAFVYEEGDGAAAEAALAGSAHRVTVEVVHNRIIVAAMEPRGAFATWDGRLHFCVNGQGVWVQKGELARHLGLPPDAVQVTNPDVGGGFGMKAATYPEYVPIAQAARLLGRPVRWFSDRSEAMLSDNAGRDLVAVAELGFDADFRITAYRVNLVSNLGAYSAQFGQGIQGELFAKVLTGVYDIQAAHLRAVGVYTNTTPVDAYRGAGRPEAILTIERAMDEAARQLGLTAEDLRERNVIRAFPYRFWTGEEIDSGDFQRILTRIGAESDLAGYPARRAASAARGLLRGRGLALYVEAILGSPVEGATVEFTEGGVLLFVGTQSNGQGHETVYTRMLAEMTGIPEDRITVVQGDSDRIAKGGGTGGSRSVTVQGTAIRASVAGLVAAFEAFLSEQEGQPVRFAEGVFRAEGRNLALTLIEAADLARGKGRADLLRHSAEIKLQGRSFPNGAHLAEVEIDPETGALRLDRYCAVDDFGTLMAPELVLGQVHGGVAQGFGQAVMEQAAYDGQGQLLSGSFMDYAIPRAADLPFIRFASEPSPTRTNPFGMKGCGEAGTVGALPALANAVRDALAPLGARLEMPYSPGRIWAAIVEAQAEPV